MREWTGFFWLGIGTRVGPLLGPRWNFQFNKVRGISSPTEEKLAFEEGLYYTMVDSQKQRTNLMSTYIRQ